MFFSLFRRRSGPPEPSETHAAFLQQALDEYHEKLERINVSWHFPRGERWDLKSSEGLFRLHFADGSRVEAEVQLIGSHHSGKREWEWAWNNGKLPEKLTSEVCQVREYGVRDNFEHLTRGTFYAPDRELGTLLAAAAAKLMNSEAVFAGADGPVVLFLSLKKLRRVER